MSVDAGTAITCPVCNATQARFKKSVPNNEPVLYGDLEIVARWAFMGRPTCCHWCGFGPIYVNDQGSFHFNSPTGWVSHRFAQKK